MNLFWSLATSMVLVALAFVLPPLFRRNAPAQQVAPGALNTEVTRQRLAELEQDLANGRIEQDRYDAAREDLERELLSDLAADKNRTLQPVRGGRWAALVIAVVVPLCAVQLYRILGNERLIALLQQPQPAGAQAQSGQTSMSVEEMVTRLAERLKQTPDDLRGWAMLAKSYSVLERYDQAIPAYQNVMRLGGGNNAAILADYADALATNGNGLFTDEIGKLLTDALGMEPDNLKALWLAGHWKRQSGDITTALEYWERAARLMPADSEDGKIIRQQIADVRTAGGLPPAGLPETTVATAQPAAAATSLQVTVALDPALRDKAAPTDTVFIYARAASGPPMPLAIARKQVSDLPLTVTLDDSMAMAPGMTLSRFPELSVGARISKSGNAMPQSGDLQGLRTPVHAADSKSLEIVIDQQLP